MRVLHVVPSYFPAHVYGGPIYSVHSLCSHLCGMGCEVRVLTTNTNGRDAVLDVETGSETRLEGGLRVRYCARWLPESVSPSLLRHLPEAVGWCDVIHLTAVYNFTTLPTLAAASLWGRPVVWSPRGSLQPWEGDRRPGLKRAWRWACRPVMPRKLVLHATSDAEARDCRSRFPGIDAAVIANGVEEATDRARPGESPTLRLLYLGRLSAKKGIENLIRACAQLDADSPAGEPALDWSLTIAGRGESAADVQRLRDGLGLAAKVRLAGEVIGEAKQRLFEESDVLVLPSYIENFGNVVAEALAHGVPVITSRNTPWQRVEEVGCGLWVENDPASLCEALRRICRMPLREMGRRGRAWMRTEFGWRSRATEMASLYQHLIASRRAAADAVPGTPAPPTAGA